MRPSAKAVIPIATPIKSPRALLEEIAALVHGRRDLMDLLDAQARLMPRRVFRSADLDGKELLAIYLEEHAAFFELVRDRLRPGLRVLEVGGGLGFFHVLARAAGADIVSLEPSASGFSVVRRFALSLLESTTMEPERFVDARIEDWPAPDASFDLIVSNNVLEHVDDVARVMGDMCRLTAPGGVQVHHCPNYMFPYEPHYKVPVLPCAVQASGLLCWRSFRQDALWQSLNSINAVAVVRLARRLGARVRFRNAAAFTLGRLDAGGYLSARHGWITRLALHPAVRAVLVRIPPAVMSPMIFEIRKEPAGA